jgi:hypothetical protein
MKVKNLSTNGLLMLYNPIRAALEQDDNTPKGQPKLYGVRDTADWREWADELETELDARKVSYNKIKW